MESNVGLAVRATANHLLGTLSLDIADVSIGKVQIEEILNLRQRIGDQDGVAYSLNGLGLIAMSDGLKLTRESTEAPPQTTPLRLTRREQDILRLLSQRRTDPEIAAQLFISTKTASNHAYNILSKLSVKNRREAAEFALKHSLV